MVEPETAGDPIEHRLFSQISLNWAGIPLRSFEILLNYICGTTTQTGLTVRAKLLEGEYAKGLKVSDEQITWPLWFFTHNVSFFPKHYILIAALCISR